MLAVTTEKMVPTSIRMIAQRRVTALILLLRHACTNRRCPQSQLRCPQPQLHPPLQHRERQHTLPLSQLTRLCTPVSTIDKMGRMLRNTSEARPVMLTLLSQWRPRRDVRIRSRQKAPAVPRPALPQQMFSLFLDLPRQTC